MLAKLLYKQGTSVGDGIKGGTEEKPTTTVLYSI